MERQPFAHLRAMDKPVHLTEVRPLSDPDHGSEVVELVFDGEVPGMGRIQDGKTIVTRSYAPGEAPHIPKPETPVKVVTDVEETVMVKRLDPTTGEKRYTAVTQRRPLFSSSLAQR